MKTIKFQGYSDDTFACTGPGINVDHDNCNNGKPILMRVDAGGESVVVYGHYAPLGATAGWLIGVSPADFDGDERHIPDWNIYFEPSDREYSPRMVMENIPDDAVVYLITKDGKKIGAGR